MTFPCPAIVAYSSKGAPKGHEWIAVFHEDKEWFDPRQKKTVKAGRLPIIFSASSEKEVRAKATGWWAGEQEKNLRLEALIESRKGPKPNLRRKA